MAAISGTLSRVEGVHTGAGTLEDQGTSFQTLMRRGSRIPSGEAIPRPIYAALRKGDEAKVISRVQEMHLVGKPIMRRIIRTSSQYGAFDVLRRFDSAEISQRDIDVSFLLAAGFGHTEICKYWLDEKGADIEARTARHGNQGMHMAFRHKHAETARFLHSRGASIGSPDEHMGSRPVHISVIKNSPEMYQLARELGASIDARTAGRFTDTGSHLAAYYGSLEMINVQADAGANLNMPNKFGFNPLDIARRAGQVQAMDRLRELGAVRSTNVNVSMLKRRKGGLMGWEKKRIMSDITAHDPYSYR